VSYREHPPAPALAARVACTWESARGDGEPGVILPDGCIDLVHRPGHGLQTAGPDTVPRPAGARGAGVAVGLRLRTGSADPWVLEATADELRDRVVGVTALWGPEGERLEEALDGAPTPALRRALLERAVGERMAARARVRDSLVDAAVERLRRDPGGAVGSLAPALGVSERHLRRRLRPVLGYGPKTLARILRFQRLLALAEARRDGEPGLAELALEAGYADQAHMTAECTRLAGAPPTAVLGVRAPRGDVRFVKDAGLRAA
jgi:AraC-like DNA-binding protein